MADEIDLANRAKSGDGGALANLVARKRSIMLLTALRGLNHRDDAEDAVAAAVLQIAVNIHHLRSPERVGGWMCAIVRREALRIRSERLPCDPGSEFEQAPSTRSDESDTALALDLSDALNCLPVHQSEVLTCYYLDGLPVSAIAANLGRPVGTIKRWLFDGRQRLRNELKGYGSMDSPWQVKIVGRDLHPQGLETMTGALAQAGYAVTQVLDDANKLIDRVKHPDAPTLSTPTDGAYMILLGSTFRSGSYGWSSEPGALSGDPGPDLIKQMLEGLSEGRVWLAEIAKARKRAQRQIQKQQKTESSSSGEGPKVSSSPP